MILEREEQNVAHCQIYKVQYVHAPYGMRGAEDAFQDHENEKETTTTTFYLSAVRVVIKTLKLCWLCYVLVSVLFLFVPAGEQ